MSLPFAVAASLYLHCNRGAADIATNELQIESLCQDMSRKYASLSFHFRRQYCHDGEESQYEYFLDVSVAETATATTIVATAADPHGGDDPEIRQHHNGNLDHRCDDRTQRPSARRTDSSYSVAYFAVTYRQEGRVREDTAPSHMKGMVSIHSCCFFCCLDRVNMAVNGCQGVREQIAFFF